MHPNHSLHTHPILHKDEAPSRAQNTHTQQTKSAYEWFELETDETVSFALESVS